MARDPKIILWQAAANAEISGSNVQGMLPEAVENQLAETTSPYRLAATLASS